MKSGSGRSMSHSSMVSLSATVIPPPARPEQDLISKEGHASCVTNTWLLAQPEQARTPTETKGPSDTLRPKRAASAAYCSAAPRPAPETDGIATRGSVEGTCQGVPHVEGIPQQQRSGRVYGRGGHELVLHAADAAGSHRLQERLPQLLRNLHSTALALRRHTLRP